ncbi:restriction endonuclease subunit S [Chryseobacterium sp. CBTAP 102]|uniref:restriction endonuclease subunit S n=1 Tax=Chryseobacterium sp. CBTAP 102 TaxID=2135644 RepID=UPI0015E890FE|nr:restriction endonuclease subunit S [Chryseobacterium sp. CBTAP 102]
MQRYEKYKDSGVDWIGEIPRHWKRTAVKNLLEIPITDGPHTTPILYETGIPFISAEAVKNNSLDFTKKRGYISQKDHDEFCKKYSPKRNDIYMVKSGATTGNIAIVETDLEFSIWSPLAVFRSSYRLKPKFLFFVLQSIYFKKSVELNWSFGTQQNIGMGVLSNLPIVYPNISEQETIATFLDDKTSKIDQTIAIKEKEIELLKERRQILIQKAVTKGLDENVKIKDSGVDWIGEIPEHWEVRKLKYCLSSKLKYGANESGVEYDLELPRYIRITDFGFDGKLSEEKKLSLTWQQGKDYLLKDGDILFARSGATVGKSYQFKTSMSFEKHYSFAGYLIKAEASEEIILSDYLYLYTNSNLFDNWKSAIFNKATIENIGADKYSILSVVVPPINEQKEILSEYNAKNKKIEKAILLKQQEIEKLKEYKTVLIDNVVTGKVRVS